MGPQLCAVICAGAGDFVVEAGDYRTAEVLWDRERQLSEPGATPTGLFAGVGLDAVGQAKAIFWGEADMG